MIDMKKVNRKIQLQICKIGKLCREHRLTLVIAESCTGGGLAYFITNEPECSAILERGYVVYSNQAKESLLEVSSEALQTAGAVSEEVARQMAEGALKNSIAQLAIATSGIAGEDIEPSAHENKGIVWIACAGIHKETVCKKYFIKGTRNTFNMKCISFSLELLQHFIVKNFS